MAASGNFGALAPDHLQPFQPRAIAQHQLRPANRRAASVVFTGFGPGQVDHAGLGVIGAKDDIAKSALTTKINGGNARNFLD